ncbi:MAG: alanine--tRNA ligase [Tissierellia bacterium]|nr:alanine--tRNA ligase [Tissierellia bacterium]
MKKLGLHALRSEFLDFFKEKNHLILPSFSLIPEDDPSLLLIGAGMAPMKKFFTGEAPAPAKRVSSCQKCIRTGDIENVGKTDRHATYFEMLGNFSFGDYFKEEAIAWAWEFLTKNLDIPREDIWVTVFEEDDEAEEIWHKKIGLSMDRIVRLGKEDNFWELAVGPSGPCSEIYVDRGEAYGCGKDTCKPGCDCDRFLEVWNLVFTQFDKDEDGNYHPLAHPNIDTGMGLERIAAYLQGVNNIFEIDAIEDLLKQVAQRAGYVYGSDPKKDESIRIITDHIRAVTFMISDGIVPSNEGRGYVLRRLIRRAARHGRLVGLEEAYLYDLSKEVIDSWSIEYKDLETNRDMIHEVIKREEERFLKTLEEGLVHLDSLVQDLKKNKKTLLSGQDAFKLYDTFGFPLDLTQEVLKEEGMAADEEAFRAQMDRQRHLARAASKANEEVGWSHDKKDSLFKDLAIDKNLFVGYDHLETQTQIIHFIEKDQVSSSLEEEGLVIIDPSPFYPQGGGQVGDRGTLEGDGFKLEVLDTQGQIGQLSYSRVRLVEGQAKTGPALARVDIPRREATRRNHSSTHLLHRALRKTLGDHVKQAGSLVSPEGLRFDFSHYSGLKREELVEIENQVNQDILASLEVRVEEMDLASAEAMGAIGLFEDKYGERVRVVSMGDRSIELCGGTHVDNTAQIGLFKILSESGISAGVRRIEAKTSLSLKAYLDELLEERGALADFLKTSPDQLMDRLKQQAKELKDLNKELEAFRRENAMNQGDALLESILEEAGYKYIAAQVSGVSMEEMRLMAEKLRDQAGAVVVLGSKIAEGKLNFVATVPKAYIDKGIKAGDLVKQVAKKAGGGGGGRPDMASAGGKNVEKLQEALDQVKEFLAQA